MKHHGIPGPNSGGSGGRGNDRRPKVLAATAVTVGCLAAGAGVYVQRRRAQAASGTPIKRFQVHSTVVEALAGAIGEIAQISLLYPLDTIKVRCQATGNTAGVVVRELLQQGFNMQLVKTLYAGVVGAAVCSIMVGAVHYASYESSRRQLLTQLSTASFLQSTPFSNANAASSGAQTAGESSAVRPARSPCDEPDGAASSSGRGSPNADSQDAKQHRGKEGRHGKGQHVVAAADEGAGLPGVADGSSGGVSVAAATAAVTDKRPKIIANVLAAVIAALVTAVVESPCELFRHNAQAGLMPGSFLKEMFTVVRKEGPTGLYWGFLPHCLEAWPHDISELMTYGYLKDATSDAAKPASRHYEWMRSVPVHVSDLLTGAAAGAVAVCVSMPFDTCKTYMQTHGTSLEGKSILRGMQLFIRTGNRMIANGGISSLYVGMTPRLLQQVPSAMICWYSIEAFQRFMLPYTFGNGHADYEQEGAVVGDDGHARPVESALSLCHSKGVSRSTHGRPAGAESCLAQVVPPAMTMPVSALEMELQPLSRSILWPQHVPVGLTQSQVPWHQRRLALAVTRDNQERQ